MRTRASEGYDEDRLPWLETVEDDYRPHSSVGRSILLVVLALLVLGGAGFGYWWFQRQQGQAGTGALIPAPEGDYKVRPDEPGGMKVDGEGDSVFATSQGATSNASINAAALPETPIQGQRAAAPAATGPATKSATLAVPGASQGAQAGAPTRAASVAAPGPGSGSLIQLGAFPNEGGANIAWVRLSKRFGYLAPLGKSVERGESNGNTVWRLRVNAGSNMQARELCGRLKVAGENCFVTN